MDILPVHYHVAALILAGIGFFGLLVRRSIIGMTLSILLIFDAACMGFIAAGAPGQAWVLCIIAAASAESAAGVTLAVLIYKRMQIRSIDGMHSLKG